MRLTEATKIAEEIKSWLSPYCQTIEIVGSVRRRKAEVGDVELLCIPLIEYENPQNYFQDIGIELPPTVNKLDDETHRLIYVGLLGYRLNSKGSRVYGKKNKLLIHVASGFPV
ncbi:unnamed protein product, partial [marine sediment metagenome]